MGCICSTYKINYIQFKNLNNTQLFNITNETFLAKIVDVYDGDTCKAIIKFRGQYNVFKIRMYGYDSPEIRKYGNNTLKPGEKEAGLAAKRFLSQLILNKIVYLETKGFEKYGRLLANIYLINSQCICSDLKGTFINQYMIDNKHGYVYTGKTKKKYTE